MAIDAVGLWRPAPYIDGALEQGAPAAHRARGREGRPSEEQERSPQDATLRAEERQSPEPPEPPKRSDPKPLRQDVAFTLQRGIGLLWSAGIEAAPDRIDQNACLSLLREASPLLSP